MTSPHQFHFNHTHIFITIAPLRNPFIEIVLVNFFIAISFCSNR
ncbi:hypothetical protein MtrunA17_Chr4g0011561 [Medicago truncatula]|uniref:Transmembrane protein n=1 Tax=Medicago truncatula TaxID=3880 RepID=A0A396I3F6_MEDTR|nr:hypothetical protein MtrunA17_Chr4g0011561 [Medicago truncatula]